MAIVLGVLAALAIISAVGSASKVARQRSGQLAKTGRSAQPSSTPALPAAEPAAIQPEPVQARSPQIEPVPTESQTVEPAIEPASAPSSQPQSIESAPAIEPAPEPVIAELAPEVNLDPVAEELVESIIERMPDVPMAASLLVSEVVNPESNDLGVQLDRPNFPIDPQETPPTHHGNNLIDEIAEIDQGDRISQLALAVEDPDSVMRVSAAYALGDLATRTQGADRDQIIAILMRLSQDVDPQVRVQAANALGNIGNPVMGE